MPQAPIHWITAEARRSDAERQRCYVQRGRQHQGESDEHLDALWINGMRAWAAVIHPRPLVLDEIEAEMSLRDRKPPEDRAGAELAAIIAGTGRLLEAQPREIVRSVVAESMAEVSVFALYQQKAPAARF